MSVKWVTSRCAVIPKNHSAKPDINVAKSPAIVIVLQMMYRKSRPDIGRLGLASVLSFGRSEPLGRPTHACGCEAHNATINAYRTLR
jgi:hypothetical protein